MNTLEILRLYELERFTYVQIAAHAGVGKSTVGDLISRCRKAGIDYQKASSMTEAELDQVIHPVATGRKQVHAEPDWPKYHAELQSSRRKNLQYIWTEEYRPENPNGYSYSRFCALYGQWCLSTGKQVVMPQDREPGKELFIDWVGDKPKCVVDTATGELVEAHFFVCTLGDSSYPFVEAFPNETQTSWTQAHLDAFEYYGGVPLILVPDNTKTAVIHRTMYDPELNHSYRSLANHYALAILPARVRKPRDKGAVESGVGWLETWLLGWLEDKIYFTFEQLNADIRKRLTELSNRDFQKRPGSRFSNFISLDKPALRPLPKDSFDVFETKIVHKVSNDYHVEYDGFYYSVPYMYYKQEVSIHAYPKRIEIFNTDGERIALHSRHFVGKRYVTEIDHMPANHRAIVEQRSRDGADYRRIAMKIGEYTTRFIDGMLKSGPVEQQYYKSCNGILFGFVNKYGNTRVESACKKACRLNSFTYTTIKNILSKGLDQIPEVPESQTTPTPEHENLRTKEWA